MTVRRAVALLLLAAATVLAAWGGSRWLRVQSRQQLERLQAAVVAVEAYPRRLAGEHDAAVEEGERLDRAIEEAKARVGKRHAEARRTTAMRRQTARIYRILALRRQRAPLAAELTPPRPPGEDD
ncbi:MAG: hypothetical protein ACYTGX_03170 [Planctomycetota bacterium]|jgi:hypothetical protein